MLDVEGGAQQDRFPGGTQQIALRMAEELGPRASVLERDRAQHRTTRRRHAALVGPTAATSRQGRHRGDPARTPRAAIAFDPALPAEYEKLAQHWPQGNLSKAYAAYDTPFWRADGCSGEALSDEGPVFITFDVSPSDDGAGHSAGLHRCADIRPAVRRASAASARWPASPTLFGDAAAASDRLRRPLLGHRGIRAGRPDRRGAAGLVDDVRAVAAQAGRRHLLGGHRNRRPVDRLPRRRRAIGQARRRRGAPALTGAARS